MKKGISICILLISIIFLTACKKTDTLYEFSFYDYMDTYISVNLYTDSQEKADEHQTYIEDVYSEYHELSTNYEPLKTDSAYLENIYSINQKNNQVIEIDYDLYVLIQKSEEIKTLTDGYFDISVGEVVNIWKNIILDVNGDEENTTKEIPETVFQNALTQVSEIELESNVIELSDTDGHYYIQVKSTHAQLDLGAISKGYATQIVYEYLVEQGVKYFSISAGSSSIAVGQNIKRDGGVFNVELDNPVKNEIAGQAYGMIYVNDIGVTTSGNYEQYVLYQGLRYHHIVSPKTKLPMQYYHTVTILGQDLGILDAVSTALFSMPAQVLSDWIALHQEVLGIEIIQFNYDTTITTYLTDTVFEEYSG